MDHSGTPIRFPSTANLAIDSFDRYPNRVPPAPDVITFGSAANFTIQTNQNIMSGFFTRFGVVEVVLDYFVPNVSVATANNTIIATIASVTHTITVPNGFYSVSTLVATLLPLLTAAFSGVTFGFTGVAGSKSLTSDSPMTITPTNLSTNLALTTATPLSSNPILIPYLIPTNYTYLDFVCSNLTYQQGLKDATTSTSTRDVLYRWNFAWDGPSPIDADGYPIYQGYQPFNQRRYLSFPKQIKWNGDQPLGQLSFQVYGTNGTMVPYAEANFEYQMTLLVSEQ